MIAEKSPALGKAARSLLEFSEDEVARYRLERMRLAATPRAQTAGNENSHPTPAPPCFFAKRILFYIIGGF
jgi:hypothetical protein